MEIKSKQRANERGSYYISTRTGKHPTGKGYVELDYMDVAVFAIGGTLIMIAAKELEATTTYRELLSAVQGGIATSIGEINRTVIGFVVNYKEPVTPFVAFDGKIYDIVT